MTSLAVLRRPSGAFAMLAVDQREALRAMLAAARPNETPITDEDLCSFKLEAARILSPYASAILIDKQFAFDKAVEQAAVDPGCGLICSADHFISAHDELVGEVEIDPAVDFASARRQGAAALKLLVLHRPDQPAKGRQEFVERFVGMCRDAGILSIIEPVSRKPVEGGDFDWNEGVLQAARELGNLGQDLYKGEMPLHGRGDVSEMKRQCAKMSASIGSPWVILSSGVAEDDFADAIRIACSEGASGFLAGRAVWASCLGADDLRASLSTSAAGRLQEFAAVADESVR